jgi:hypothetical protein
MEIMCASRIYLLRPPSQASILPPILVVASAAKEERPLV